MRPDDSEKRTALPLDGIRVLDFTRALAGPYGTQVLGDFGADVIRIEQPPVEGGLISDRGSGVTKMGDESAVFMMYNRNKRSLCLDLRSGSARPILERLIADADVLVQNFRPGIAEQIGISWEHVHALNPRLVYVSVNGFGSTGPWRERQGIDVVLQAVSGMMSVTGEPYGEPLLSGAPIADYAAAMLHVQGTLLALIERERSGVGQHVEVSMLAATIQSLGHRLGPYLASGRNPVRQGSVHAEVAPFQSFRTADGYGIGGPMRQKHWPAFCDAIGLPELVDDPRFATNDLRVANKAELGRIVAPRFLTRTSAEWDEILNANNIPFGIVNSFDDIFHSEQVKAIGLLAEVDHPTAGTIPMVGPAITLSSTPGSVRLAPPLAGQHTRDVLRQLGYTDDEVDSLFSEGVAYEDTPASSAVPLAT